MEAHTPSSALVGVIDGVVGFRLVHNFGAAWGSFSGMVIVLVIVSIVLCAIILAYMIYVAKEASVLETVGLALTGRIYAQPRSGCRAPTRFRVAPIMSAA